jgi:hypothetical protein
MFEHCNNVHANRVLDLFYDALSTAVVMVKMVTINDMERMWKDAVMGYFKVLFQHSLGLSGKYGS